MSVDHTEERAQETAQEISQETKARQSHARDVIHDYLSAQANNELLRFITCGSVDDGKSTLIGRLLYEAKCLFEDQVATLERDSERFGTQEGSIDFALLVDGLSAEREQGITIDVAYRFFKTDKRAFIVADTPGHEQYTRNMVTGASTADAAVLLVDARLGVLPQTRRHAYIVSLLRVKRVIVAINKMDLVGYSEARFREISAEINEVADELNIEAPVIIPVSALCGDCVMRHSEALAWYQGPTLMGALESAPTQQQQVTEREDAEGLGPLRMFVQWVNRPHLDFRGVSGTITRGAVRPGDEVIALPSGERARISAIVTMDGELEEARIGQAVTLTFDREIDASRGDLICAGRAPAELTDQVSAHLVWMSADEALSGRSYLLKLGALTLNATLTTIKHSVDIETYREQPATSLQLNDIARVQLRFDRQVPFDAYYNDKALGSFILIDRRTYATVGAGMIEHSLRRANNVHRHSHQVTRARRETLNGHTGFAVWLTGLSGSGKSTLADHLERLLHAQGIHTYLLDGDNVRHGLNHDLGFTAPDRVENIRRVSEVAKLMVDAGLVVISAFISPFRADRDQARARFDEHSFCEVYVNTPLEVAESRDPKGLYRKARAGEIPNFTGIGSPYEAPQNPDVIINTTDHSPEESARELYEAIKPLLAFSASLSADEPDSST